jgi:hypothetical protein
MSLYESTVPQFKKMLENLDKWLAKATEHAKKKNADPNEFLKARLVIDQYPLVRQVQSACDAAKFCCARLTAKEAPKHPDTETTMEELHARIRACVAYLDTFKPGDFEGSEKRAIDLPFLEGKKVSGQNYVCELVLPNFYFHVTTAYAILRTNGVDVGKMDFIGGITFLA